MYCTHQCTPASALQPPSSIRRRRPPQHLRSSPSRVTTAFLLPAPLFFSNHLFSAIFDVFCFVNYVDLPSPDSHPKPLLCPNLNPLVACASGGMCLGPASRVSGQNPMLQGSKSMLSVSYELTLTLTLTITLALCLRAMWCTAIRLSTKSWCSLPWPLSLPVL